MCGRFFGWTQPQQAVLNAAHLLLFQYLLAPVLIGLERDFF